MDHLMNYIAHVLVGYGIRRTLGGIPLGFVLLVAAAAAWFLVRRSARRPRYRARRR